MKVYFVRHGSTESWEKQICQTEFEPLNQKGQIQVQKLAQRLKKMNFDLIISSPYLRTVQTTQAISSDFLISPLFTEVKKPKEVVGKVGTIPYVTTILDKIEQMYLIDPHWHYSDEENFEDLKNRGLKALKFLESQNKENILVVSHCYFISILIGLMMLSEKFSPEVLLGLKKVFYMENTGISICSYENNRWQFQCWNDYSHLLSE
jgi:broad specificity phosphatase PhoE